MILILTEFDEGLGFNKPSSLSSLSLINHSRNSSGLSLFLITNETNFTKNLIKGVKSEKAKFSFF